MADLSMCQWEMCPKHDNCRRFLAEPSPDQVYMNFHNICHQDNNYKWQWTTITEFVKKEEVQT